MYIWPGQAWCCCVLIVCYARLGCHISIWRIYVRGFAIFTVIGSYIAKKRLTSGYSSFIVRVNLRDHHWAKIHHRHIAKYHENNIQTHNMHFFVLHALQAYISIGTHRINGKRSRDQMIKRDIESKIFEILGKYLLASKMSLSLIAIFNSLFFFP